MKQAQRAPEISPDVVALVSAAREGRVHQLGEHGTPYTRRQSERRVKTSEKKTDETPTSLANTAAQTAPTRGRSRKSLTANVEEQADETPTSPANTAARTAPARGRKSPVTANVETLDPPSTTPSTKRKARSKKAELNGILEGDSEGGTSEHASPPKKIGRGRLRSPTETGSEASESTSVDKKRKADDLNITAILDETRRNLSGDIEKAHQKMMAEIKRSHQAMSARLVEVEKKGLTKPALTELLKQVTSAGTKSSAELLQKFPDFSTQLTATHDAIERLPNTLTSQLRGSEKPKERDPLGSEKTKERDPLEPAGVQAELRFALSQLPAELAKALRPAPPAGNQDGVLKVIQDLTAGISTKDRDLLWIEQNRGVALKKKAKKKKKKRKEKQAQKEKEKEQVMKEKEQIMQLAKKEKKAAKREKEERRKQELDEEKKKLLALLNQTGVLRKDRKYRSRASSPSTEDSSSSS